MNMLFLALVISQPPAAPDELPPRVPGIVREVIQVPPVPVVPADPDEEEQPATPAPKSARDKLWDKAALLGRPFVIFVNTPSRGLRGADTYEADEYRGDSTPRVIVFRPPSESGLSYSPRVSDAQLIGARVEVSFPASPFAYPGLRPGEERRTADDKAPWPVGLPFPEGAILYAPAKFTQRTFNKGIIERVSRTELKMKWQVPGGMEGVHGWRSDLYKFVPGGFQDSWKSWIPVFNGSNDQDEVAWVRSRPEGTYYMDVLSNGGKVFEIRAREKAKDYKGNLKWESFVMFRDAKARPAGYVPLTSKQCAACHAEAGTGGYGVGLVPGGDTIISDPFPAIQ